MEGRTWDDLAAVAMKTKVITGKLGFVVVDTALFFGNIWNTLPCWARA
jgi:hypothetical protein